MSSGPEVNRGWGVQLPEWMAGKAARAIAAAGLGAGVLMVNGACAADRVDYPSDTAMFVRAGTNVYDDEDTATKCGKTTADATEVPVGQAVTVGNAAGDGQVQKYEFDGLPLGADHSCEGTVFVYKGDSSPAPPGN